MEKEKRLFQVLDEMNQADTENKTRTVAISNTMLRCKTVKAGGEITMGADNKSLVDLVSDKAIAILVVIDRAEYEKFK